MVFLRSFINVTNFNAHALLDRFKKFAVDCQKLTLILPKTDSNKIYGLQLIRSSSSPAANYIEAIEAFSGREFIHRLKVSRKETKESVYWLELIKMTNHVYPEISKECEKLISEGTELIKILSSSISTTERNNKLKNEKLK